MLLNTKNVTQHYAENRPDDVSDIWQEEESHT